MMKVVTAAAIAAVTTGCAPAALVPAPAAQADPTFVPPTSPACNLQPTSNDLIIWERWPRLPDAATKVGDVDGVNCVPTLSDWKAGEPTGPGYCEKIAWASDNPGYDVDARPAPPLKKVIETQGDC